MGKIRTDIKKFAFEGITDQLKQAVWSYLWTILAPIMTGVLAYTEGFPWSVILLMTLAAFAFISTGLYQFSQWQHARSPQNKLIFAGILVRGKKDSDNPEKLKGLSLGFSVNNIAQFPIEYEVRQIKTGLDR